MYTRILVPLDGSKTAEAVLPYARVLVSDLKVPVELLTVIDVAELSKHLPGRKRPLYGRAGCSRWQHHQQSRDGQKHADSHGDPWSFRAQPVAAGEHC
jgi:nucleotide-binding universal stress UspA family protein